MDETMTEQMAVFTDTDAALRFALRFAVQQHSSSELAGLRGPSHSDTGLNGVDGAAQAGMVRAEMAKLTPTQRAVLIGRYALPDVVCTCRRPCCGHTPNNEWTAAIAHLARETTPLFSGGMDELRSRLQTRPARHALFAFVREKPRSDSFRMKSYSDNSEITQA